MRNSNRNSKRITTSSQNLRIEFVAISALKANPFNTHVHPKQQIRKLANSIDAFGVTAPLLVDEDGVLLAGHGRLEAAKLLGLKALPVISIAGLSPAQKRA